VHLRIALPILILGRARRADNRRAHDGAVGDLDAVAVQVLVNRPQQRLTQLVALEQMPELADRRLVGGGCAPDVGSSSASLPGYNGVAGILVRWEYSPKNFLDFLQRAAICILLRQF
jgi:hypothetical protein